MASDDSTTTLATLSQEVKNFRRERDWEKFNDPHDLAAALSVEAGELLELFLWKKAENTRALAMQEGPLRHRMAEELADVFTYTLMIADAAGFDLVSIFRAKMIKNAARYPIEKVKGFAIDKASQRDE